MKKSRKKHSPEFKAKVALEAIREQEAVAAIAHRHKLHANIVYKWKRQFLEQMPVVFQTDKDAVTGSTEREAELLQKIGELTMERDFLSNGLGRLK